ncbi:HlyC/CorC family transporter [Actinomyces sp. zg-332]|uniref:hemolysin family protein n=1 Tax=Actinomyces sp. zg-332 TaxID=2708340 RepID=UPI0014243A05|nr:hemolysin family protein [Actinomyces sp. zg-332]QPK94487.1 HlyC/CorC family transporter [Actinomyces sp. zg-332]
MDYIWFLILGLVLGIFSSIVLTGENAVERLSRASIDETKYGKKDKEKLYWLVDNVMQSILSLKVFFVQIFGSAVIFFTVFSFTYFTEKWVAIVFCLIFTLIFSSIFIGILPVVVGKTYAVKVAYILRNLLYGVSRINNRLNRVIVDHKQENISEFEIRTNVARDLREVVDGADSIETFEDEDREIIESVFELGDTIVREVMVPRIDMITVSPNETINTTLTLFVKSGYSRIPVVGKNIDDVYGVVYLKDILHRLHYHPDDKNELINTVMRPAHFVPETIYSDNLLRKMQEELFHIAIVVDEYGGTAGLVTIEDLLEVLVGDLFDEHDKKIQEPEEISPGIWKVPARFPINELDELLDVEIEDEDVDTVNGLLAKAIGKVPLPGTSGKIYGLNLIAQEAIGRRKQIGAIVISKNDEFEE